MPEVRIKSPNIDDIFNKWKQKANRQKKKELEKQFGTKGAVFSVDTISAGETVKETLKEAAVYFQVEEKAETSKEQKKEEQGDIKELSKNTFYLIKGAGVDKSKWKGPDIVPMFDSIEKIPCSDCKGKGYIESKCKECTNGNKTTEMTVLVGEEQKKEKKPFKYGCNTCYKTGAIRNRCKTCDGDGTTYKWKILPVPFVSKMAIVPKLYSSAPTKYEKQIGEELGELIESVEGIKIQSVKDLNDKKVEPNLGYYNKNISKVVKKAASDYQKFEKDKDYKIKSQIYVFPLIQIFCESKKGKKFEIYSLGSEQKFFTYSNF